MAALDSPLPQFFELDGSPLDAGFIYVGQIDLNPETNPIPVFWDAAMTVPASQPLRTLNGMIARDGTPAFVYVATDHSMMIRSSRGEQVLYAPKSQLFSLIQTIADMVMDEIPVSPFIAGLLDDPDAATARATLGAAKSGANSDITSLAGLTTPLSLGQGGTGQNTAPGVQSILPVQQARIDVASASTVNLTTAAPNTDHINLTGTTTINAFTVAAGRLIFVRFSGTMVLASGAAITTQTGGNITARNGDTCVLRALSANVVEVLSYREGRWGHHEGAPPLYALRAWVNFVGSTGAIRASGNVSSVTRNGPGDYTVNFSTPMPDTNYGMLPGGRQTAPNYSSVQEDAQTAKTTSAIRVSSVSQNSGVPTPFDSDVITLGFVR